MSSVSENARRLLSELKPGVQLVAAAKSASPKAVLEAVNAGVKIIGESYVQEAEAHYQSISKRAAWHFIGHLQSNKVKKAVALFDMVESVDSLEIAREIDRHCGATGKIMPVLIEINSGREPQKSGILPEEAEGLAKEISPLPGVKLTGLMTIGPYADNPEVLRQCFAETRKLFAKLARLNLPNVEMKYLSMGMSGSYRIAIEEGANLVRIGTKIFGARD